MGRIETIREIDPIEQARRMSERGGAHFPAADAQEKALPMKPKDVVEISDAAREAAEAARRAREAKTVQEVGELTEANASRRVGPERTLISKRREK